MLNDDKPDVAADTSQGSCLNYSSKIRSYYSKIRQFIFLLLIYS